jgi:hypothetical protein
VAQIDALPDVYYTLPEPKFTTVERIAHAEAFFATTGAFEPAVLFRNVPSSWTFSVGGRSLSLAFRFDQRSRR